MKNLIPILLLFITGITYSQLNTEPPKIITEIDKEVERIDSLPDSLKVVRLEYNGSNKTSEILITLENNKIVKIHRTDNYIVSSLNPPSTTTTYYFSYNKLIFSRALYYRAYYSPLKSILQNPDSSVLESADIFYYDYDELVSKPKLFRSEYDTIYLHIFFQTEGYNLLKEYSYLQNYNPFKNIQYNRVVAYDYEGRGGRQIINFNNKLDKSAVLPGKTLTLQLQEKLINSITDTASYGRITAGCFDPHLGIVFYMNDSITAHVSICFECNSLASSVYLPATVHTWQVDSGDDYYFVRPVTGFSPQGRKQLKQLCHELGLGKCPDMDGTTVFDE